MNKENKHEFIPKYIMEQLAENGDENAKKSIIQMENLEKELEKKKEKKNLISSSFENDNSQNAKRILYDCENTTNLQYKLIRNEEDPPPIINDDANIVFNFTGDTRDYFKNKLNRNSIDNKGMNYMINIHYDVNHNNAFWYENQVTFGDGDGKLFLNFARSLDVIAHEWAHGLTEYINHLEYIHQSGALNEHFSDVIGTAIQQYINGQTAETADWLIGNEIVGPDFPGIALRSMKDPGTAYEWDKQVAHIRDYVKLPLDDDNGGVHYYSGIPNKAFYLVSMDIGTQLAAYLWYIAWQDKTIMKPNATFLDAYNAIIKTVEILINQGKLPKNTANSVKDAFGEVGIYDLVLV